MREIREPFHKTWVLIVNGFYKDHCGWIVKQPRRRNPRWEHAPQRPNQTLICIGVTKQSACTGEWFKFTVDQWINNEDFVMAQLEFIFSGEAPRHAVQ